MSRSIRLLLTFTSCLVLFAACEDDPEKTPTECTAGTDGCACDDAGGCAEGLVCNAASMCEPEVGETFGLVIGAMDARACELLLRQGDSRILSASYSGTTRGALRRRDPNVAIAVSRAEDSPFDADSISLVIDGDTAGVSLDSARCFDASGAELSAPDVSLN